MAALQAALAKFRSRAVEQSNVLEQGRKEREEKLAKKRDAEAKAAPNRKAPAKRKAKSSASLASEGGPSASGDAGQQHWKDLPPPNRLEPLGFRQMQVIEYLRGKHGPQTVAEILQGDLRREEDLCVELAVQPRVRVSDDGNTYTYQAAVQVKDKGALLQFLRTALKPMARGEVTDAYAAAAVDIEALQKEGLLVALHSYELQDDVLFPVDPRLAGVQPVEEEVAELWAKAEIPDDDEELAAELKKIGVKPAPRKAPRQRGAREKKKKQRKQTRIRNVTNVHMMHLFEGDAPVAIDQD